MILKGRSSAETKGCKPLVCYKIYIMLVIMVWSNLWSAEYSFVAQLKIIGTGILTMLSNWRAEEGRVLGLVLLTRHLNLELIRPAVGLFLDR